MSSCVVCWQDFSTENPPLILSCGHSFCAECCDGMTEEKTRSLKVIKCPSCRVEMRLKGQTTPPKNFSLLETLSNIDNVVERMEQLIVDEDKVVVDDDVDDDVDEEVDEEVDDDVDDYEEEEVVAPPSSEKKRSYYKYSVSFYHLLYSFSVLTKEVQSVYKSDVEWISFLQENEEEVSIEKCFYLSRFEDKTAEDFDEKILRDVRNLKKKMFCK